MKMLKERGHSVVFVTYKYENADEDKMIELYEGIEVVFVDKSKQYFPTHDNLNNSHLLWLSIHGLIVSEGYKFDYIIFPDCGGEGFFTILVSNLYRIYRNAKIITEIEGPMKDVALVNKNVLDDHYELTKLMEEYCLNNCSYFTSPTNLMINELQDYIKKSKNTIVTIPNLINSNFLDQYNQSNEIKKQIFFFGRLEYRKGPDLLIEAFAEIISDKHYEQLKLKFAGRDQYWSDYDKTFKQQWDAYIKVNNDKIEFLDFLDHSELKKVFSATWVAVFPSRWEPFGNVALEAMLAGVPIIVPKGTGLEEVVGEDYKFTFAVDDKDSLIQTLKNILELSVDEHKRLTDEVKLRAQKLLKLSEERFTSFLAENCNNAVLIEHTTNAQEIFEIFHSFALLGGDNQQRYNTLFKDYNQINDLYQNKSKEYNELATHYDIINRENQLMKEYLRTIKTVKG